MIKSILVGASFIILAAAPAFPETFTARSVEIVDAAAIVRVIPENRADISIETRAGARVAAPQVRVSGERVVIDGGLDGRIRGCGMGWFNSRGESGARISGIGDVRRAELPVITIRTPVNVNFSSNGAVYAEIGNFTEGRVHANGCGATRIGNVSGGLDVALRGSGDVDVGDVGVLNAQLQGSGALNAGDSGAANLELHGSGGLNAGAVAGNLSARVAGSGGLNVARVENGNASLDLHGSGGMRIGSVRGNVNARQGASGSLTIDSVEGGNVLLEASGSGGLNVRSGTAERLTARLGGSGGVHFGGRAQNVDAELRGSGSIHVAHADHVTRLVDNGSGSISIGN